MGRECFSRHGRARFHSVLVRDVGLQSLNTIPSEEPSRVRDARWISPSSWYRIRMESASLASGGSRGPRGQDTHLSYRDIKRCRNQYKQKITQSFQEMYVSAPKRVRITFRSLISYQTGLRDREKGKI